MQGINNLGPSLPRYDSIWDVQTLLSYIENMTDLTLLDLSAKFCMLFFLVTAQRCETLYLVELDDIVFKEIAALSKPIMYKSKADVGFTWKTLN